MENIHYVVLTAVYSRMRADKAKLEHEESGRVIATLQGRISGYNLLLEQMKEHIPFLTYEDTGEEEVNPHDMEDRDLVMLSIGLLTDRVYWTPIEKHMKYEVAQDKHYLYYKADKGRALDVTHGKRDGMLMFKGIFEAIKSEIESRREEEPLFKEELDNEDMNLDLFDFENDVDPAEAQEIEEGDIDNVEIGPDSSDLSEYDGEEGQPEEYPIEPGSAEDQAEYMPLDEYQDPPAEIGVDYAEGESWTTEETEWSGETEEAPAEGEGEEE